MSARDEISDLMFVYAELMDAGDFEGIGRTLAGASISMEGSDFTTRGQSAIVETYRRWSKVYDDNTPKTKHVITNVIVDVDDSAGTATSRAYFTVFQAVPPDLALQPILAGRYRDSFGRIDGSWRFTAMHVIWDLVGDMSSHIREGAG